MEKKKKKHNECWEELRASIIDREKMQNPGVSTTSSGRLKIRSDLLQKNIKGPWYFDDVRGSTGKYNSIDIRL